MSFETLVALNGHAAAFELEVSVDRFSSISYFWANITHQWAFTQYEPLIVSVSRLQRGLTDDHNLAASTVEVVLDNTGGDVDWLVNRDTVELSVFKAKFRLYVVAYDPASPGTLTRKQLGQFGLFDWPRRDAKSVTLMLADDTSIDGAEFALAPTLKDWVTSSLSNPANNPLCKDTATLVDDARFYLPYDAPVQLAFGNDYVDCQKTAEFEAPTSTHINWSRRSLVVCATTDTRDVNSTDVEHLYIRTENLNVTPGIGLAGNGASLGGAPLFEIPQTFKSTPTSAALSTIWTPRRSQVLTKDGRTWRIVWVDIDMQQLVLFLMKALWQSSSVLQPYLEVPTFRVVNGTLAVGGVQSVAGSQSLYGLLEFAVAGFPYSSRTYPANAVGFGDGVRAPEIAYDLLAYYSSGLTNADVDAASFQRATQVLPFFYAAGIINDMAELSTTRETSDNPDGSNTFQKVEAIGGALRKSLAELSRSGSFDIFVSWGGVFTATAQTSNFSDSLAGTGSLVTLDEMLIIDAQWEDRVPSVGERWSPHNRIYLQGKNGRIGPFDNATTVASWGRKLPVTLTTKWVAPSEYAAIANQPNLSLFNTAAVESKARQRLKFVYGSLEALQLDLGSYFLMSITRGGALTALFTNAMFKVEHIELLPSTLGVYIEAIWFDDLVAQRPYYLDDESYTLVVSSSAGRTAGVADGSTTVTFASGSLITDGVAAGDIIVLKDSTLAANAFSRFRALLIASVDDATHIKVTDPSLIFDAPSTVFVIDWEIRKGATRYASLVASDPTHYPSATAAQLYGKVTNSLGKDSGGSDGNVLLDG